MNPFRSPTPQELRQRLLAEAEIDLIEAARMAEYYIAMKAMLGARIARLQAELSSPTLQRRP